MRERDTNDVVTENLSAAPLIVGQLRNTELYELRLERLSFDCLARMLQPYPGAIPLPLKKLAGYVSWRIAELPDMGCHR
jgi:hypothetical protein